jgi:photosystem II stability/assembly factor-like uncharacterized protein
MCEIRAVDRGAGDRRTGLSHALAVVTVMASVVAFAPLRGPGTALADDPQAGAESAKAQTPASDAQKEDDRLAEKLGLTKSQIRHLRTQRALSNEVLDQLPAGAGARIVRRLSRPDLPRRRAAFRALQDRDERGQIPENARYRANQQLRASLNRQPAGKTKAAGLPTGRTIDAQNLLPNAAPPEGAGGPSSLAGLAVGSWQSLGPGNIGGRIRSILVTPPVAASQPHVILIGGAGAGIWRSTDDGASFAPVDDFMANLAVSCMAAQPNNANVMYAGTGEGYFNIDALRGAGIFKSIDGGTSWASLASTIPSASNPHFRFVNRIAVSADGSTVLAAAYRGGDEFTTTQPGLFRSVDGGATWLQIAPLVGRIIVDVDFHPTDKMVCMAASYGGLVFISGDAGVTWTSSVGIPTVGGTNLPGRVELTYAKGGSGKVVYASVDKNFGQLHRSDDNGANFVLKSTGKNYLGNQGWYSTALWAGDPADENLVMVGGLDLWRSTDGGATLKKISTWTAAQRSPHADHHAIVSHPKFGVAGDPNAKTVFFGNDGGLYVAKNVSTVGNNASEPKTGGWKELVNTLSITQFQGAAGNESTGVIVAGAQDNGTLRFKPSDGSEGWVETEGGDGGFVAADPTDPSIFYGEYVTLTIFRNNSGGDPAGPVPPSKTYISGLTSFNPWLFKPAPFRIDDAADELANFIAPFVLDPNEPNRILGGGLSLWRTDNAKAPMTATTGPTWSSIKDPIGSDLRDHPISAIAVAKGDSKIVWVGHNNGDVYRSDDGTASAPSWTQVDAGSTPLPDRYCHRITIDPTDRKRVYATFGGYSKGNVWKTVDAGTTWTDISAGLPEAPVRSLVIHPSNASHLYIGTEVGVFGSDDAGATWSPTNEGPANVSVDELFFLGKTLYAATHGRGLFRIKLTSVPAPM